MIEEHRDRIEMGRKKREAKAMNCGERGGGVRGGRRRTPYPWLDAKGWEQGKG